MGKRKVTKGKGLTTKGGIFSKMDQAIEIHFYCVNAGCLNVGGNVWYITDLIDKGNPVCPDCGEDMVAGGIELETAITVEVNGGVAEVTKNPLGIEVDIVDHDNR